MPRVAFFSRTAMVQIRWAVALVGILLSAHGHASPSFDCHKATAPIETLICASPELAKLDETVLGAFRPDAQSATGDARAALLASQRSWLLQREPACHIPATEAKQLIKEWDAMVDCVSGLYQERIAELQHSANAADASTHSGGLVHPVCLTKVLRSSWHYGPADQDSFSLKECNAEYADAPISITNRGTISATDPEYGGYYEYKSNAILPDGRQLLVFYDSGGGSGHGSQVATISRTNENGEVVVHGSTIFLGADRCGGTILSATPTDTGVFVDLAVNPDSFLQLAGWTIGGSGASNGYNDCIGTIRIWTLLKYDDDRSAVRAVSGMVRSYTSGLRATDGNHCFDVAVSKIPGALPKTLDRAALGQLVKSYKACFAKELRNKP